LNSNNSSATQKELFGRLGFDFVMFCDFGLGEFFTLSTLGGCNFLISNPFLTIFSASDVSRGGVEISLGHQQQQSPSLSASRCRECLSVHS
jgi:hypothetical protein